MGAVSLGPFSHGTRFGLLLQLAVGPVCLFVFRTSSERGVWHGMSAVWGVVFVDALYIALAGLGVTRWAESGRRRRALQYAGSAIIALFAIEILASAAGAPLLPSSSAPNGAGSGSFVAAVLLTGSNPLTILFWAGVFGAKVAAERYGRRDLWLLSLGCVTATAVFLAAIASLAAFVGRTAPILVLRLLNAVVGLALLYFAGQLVLRRVPEGEPAKGRSALPTGSE